jgi:hypothetical protein
MCPTAGIHQPASATASNVARSVDMTLSSDPIVSMPSARHSVHPTSRAAMRQATASARLPMRNSSAVTLCICIWQRGARHLFQCCYAIADIWWWHRHCVQLSQTPTFWMACASVRSPNDANGVTSPTTTFCTLAICRCVHKTSVSLLIRSHSHVPSIRLKCAPQNLAMPHLLCCAIEACHKYRRDALVDAIPLQALGDLRHSDSA